MDSPESKMANLKEEIGNPQKLYGRRSLVEMCAHKANLLMVDCDHADRPIVVLALHCFIEDVADSLSLTILFSPNITLELIRIP